jgi:hypothetical protein
MGWRNLFSSCAVVLCQFLVLAGNAGTCSTFFSGGLFGIKREIIFGVTYVLSVQYSCAVVSVFCCDGKVNFIWMPYSHDRFSKILRTFFAKKWSHIKPTYEKTISFLLCMDLQPHSHCCFSKISRNFYWFPKQYWLGFFILEKQFANFLDRGFLFLRNTLLLYSLLSWRES